MESSLVVIDADINEAYVMEGLAQRWADGPESTPALDAFVEELDAENAANAMITGRGVLGIDTDKDAYTHGNRLEVLAIKHGLSIGLPEFGSVITRGEAISEEYMFDSSLGDGPAGSPALNREKVRFMRKMIEEDAAREPYAFLAVLGKTRTLRVRKVYGEWYYDRGGWVVTYKDESSKGTLFTQDDGAFLALLNYWPGGGEDMGSAAQWDEKYVPIPR